VSPELRAELPEVARRIGKARLLGWQSQLKGSEQQLRHSVQPRLWLEVLLLGLLAEPAAVAPTPPGPGQACAEVQRPVRNAAPAPTVAQPGSAPEAAAAVTPEQAPVVSPEASAAANENLAELWQQILASLELPSTRMLLSQQAQLVRLDEHRAVVRVAGPWMAMVESRKALVEKALASALGSPRQLVLEGGGEHQPPARASAATPPPPPTPRPAASLSTAPIGAAHPVPEAPQQPLADQAGSHPNPLDDSPPLAGPPPEAPPVGSAPIDEKARRLAEFFNGEVVNDDHLNAA
jgi:DNA polymerase-3 subunit gamma/tau